MEKFVDSSKMRGDSASMQKSNPIRDKSYAFALHIVMFCKSLMTERKEFVLSKQLLRSGTSIGANVEEAIQAQSRKDFISKLSIALKEVHETHYWLRLLRDSHFASAQETRALFEETLEIIYLLTAILKSTRERGPVFT